MRCLRAPSRSSRCTGVVGSPLPPHCARARLAWLLPRTLCAVLCTWRSPLHASPRAPTSPSFLPSACPRSRRPAVYLSLRRYHSLYRLTDYAHIRFACRRRSSPRPLTSSSPPPACVSSDRDGPLSISLCTCSCRAPFSATLIWPNAYFGNSSCSLVTTFGEAVNHTFPNNPNDLSRTPATHARHSQARTEACDALSGAVQRSGRACPRGARPAEEGGMARWSERSN